MKRSSFLLVLLLICCNSTLTLPNHSILSREPKDMNGIVSRHNYWRTKVGVPPLRWSNRLSQLSKRWANHLRKENCRIYHSSGRGIFGNLYGENIYWSVRVKNTPESVVDDWAEEIQFFNPKTGGCKGGECGHYTQIIWKNTTKVGCAMVRCGEKEIWVCSYSPAGNWVGQKPY